MVSVYYYLILCIGILINKYTYNNILVPSNLSTTVDFDGRHNRSQAAPGI